MSKGIKKQGGTPKGQKTNSTEQTVGSGTRAASATPARTKRGSVKVKLHWQAQRAMKGKRRVARFTETLNVTEAQAKELRVGRLAAANDQLLEIERKELGGIPDSRTWLRTHG